MRTLFVLLAVLSISDAASAGPAAHANACEREMIKAAKRYDVPLGMLYAVGLTETGQKGSLQPYALNIDGRAIYGIDKRTALDEFARAKAAGAKLIDLGCMQINHHYHSENFASLEEMFDPRYNVDYAARFLKQLREREGSWTMAVARYNPGPNSDPPQKRYVCRVIANIVASRFGEWTPKSRTFCAP